jgi:hypothetical protein
MYQENDGNTTFEKAPGPYDWSKEAIGGNTSHFEWTPEIRAMLDRSDAERETARVRQAELEVIYRANIFESNGNTLDLNSGMLSIPSNYEGDVVFNAEDALELLDFLKAHEAEIRERVKEHEGSIDGH